MHYTLIIPPPLSPSQIPEVFLPTLGHFFFFLNYRLSTVRSTQVCTGLETSTEAWTAC